MSSYCLDNTSKIVIYGAGECGKKWFHNLYEQYHIIAFFDYNADNIKEVNGIKVYNPFKTLMFQDEIIIICLHDVVVQENVAKRLCQCGYHKIIYFPPENKFNSSIRLMQKVYRNLLEGKYSPVEIPIMDKIFEEEIEESIIRKTDKYVVLNMDIELLYYGTDISSYYLEKYNDINCTEEYKKAFEISQQYLGKPAILLKPYTEMFYSFMDGENRLGDYLLIFKQLQNLGDFPTELFIEKRYRVYQMLEQKFSLGMKTFENAPVEVELSDKGRFYVIDGMHRLLFLHGKGIKHIPVLMSIQDYEKWVSRICVQEVKKFMIANKMEKFVTHLPNPFFSKIPYEREFSVNTILKQLMEFTNEKNLKDIRFLDFSGYDGYFARHMYRMGFESVIWEQDSIKYQFELLLNELLHTKEVEVKEFLSENLGNQEFDLGYVNWNVLLENNETIFDIINTHIKKILILEYTATENILSIVMKETGFKYYKTLASRFHDGKRCNIDILLL